MVIPKKSLGQHWLDDESSLKAMVTMAAVQSGDSVLEVGPGLGTLTAQLVDQASTVVAVEFDEALALELPSRIPNKNLKVVHQDILRFDTTTMPAGYKVVANIPYYLTSKLVQTFSEAPNPPTVMVLLVQKEVAERLAAPSGSLSVLGVSAQFCHDVTLGAVVPAALFEPPPEVDSQIVCLKRRPQPLFSDILPESFFRVVKAGFSQRRKKLRSSLAGGLSITKPEAERLLGAAGVSPDSRAQELSLKQWYELAKAYG